MLNERERGFMVDLWRRIDEYLKKYSVNGKKLRIALPEDISWEGKIPDLVILNEKGIPVLIIETKRKETTSKEFLNPLSPAPIAQAACYAVLALYEYDLNETPLFATANKDALILFKGISRDELENIIDIDKCYERKKSPGEWARALKPNGLSTLLGKHIVARIDDPLKGESIKKLFDYVGKKLSGQTLSPIVFYKVFVSQLRRYVQDLHSYIKNAVEDKLLKDKEYFIQLYNGAKSMGYPYGLLSEGLLTINCSSYPRKLCEHVKDILEKELRTDSLTPERAYEILLSLSEKELSELCSEFFKVKKVRSSTRKVLKGVRVREILSFDNLTIMMAYVLVNKILAYKILELHYAAHIPRLKPIEYGETISIYGKQFKINSPNDLLAVLNYIFAHASLELEEKLKIRDFKPIFWAGMYDSVILEGIEAIDQINKIIDLIDGLKQELKYLPGVIGYVYEGLLSPSERHRLGQFYTPPAVARLITRWAIRSGSDKVLDAGCGSGTFLIEAYKRLLLLKFNKDYDSDQYPTCNERYNEHQEILNQLYGIDRNAFASTLTSIHLMLMDPRCSISKLNVETRDYFTIGNVLDSENSEGGFDAIIGNPPYTRWVEIPDDTKKKILNKLESELSKYDLKANLRRGREPGIYVYWVIHSTKNLLKNNGRLGLIISNMWLQTDYGIDFGRFLLDNFRVKALIDLSFRIFDALISTVIVLAEKEENRETRDNNVVTLIRIPPKIRGEILDIERTGKVLDEILRCIECSFRKDGSFDPEILSKCAEEYGIYFKQIKQSEMPLDRKWVSLFFADAEDVLCKLEGHPLIMKIGEWFEPSYGNALYLCLTSWGSISGVRNLGAKDFFYFSDSKRKKWNIPLQFLAPAITRSQCVKTFTFIQEDWERLKEEGKDVFMFVCNEALNELPKEVREYIRWGETECRTQIRGTRGGGRICSEAEACKTRIKHPKIFKGWYDLGGYIPTPLMAIRQAFYHQQFFLCRKSMISYDAIITFIPRVRIKMTSMKYDPKDYKQYLPNMETNIELDEAEIKALLAYLNSTFNWLWLEQKGRRTGGGIIALEAQHARDMPIINVKKLDREDIESLAYLFDKLEDTARRLLTDEKLKKQEMFEKLKPCFQELDRKIADILGIFIDTEWLWNVAWEMMERRVKGAKGFTRPGVRISIDVRVRRTRDSENSSPVVPLDKWMMSEED
ncbi:N-6 DNA methylase [Thermococcus sp.]